MKREECKKGRYCLGIYTCYGIGQGISMCPGYHKRHRIKTALKKLLLSLIAYLCVYDNNYI